MNKKITILLLCVNFLAFAMNPGDDDWPNTRIHWKIATYTRQLYRPENWSEYEEAREKLPALWKELDKQIEEDQKKEVTVLIDKTSHTGHVDLWKKHREAYHKSLQEQLTIAKLNNNSRKVKCIERELHSFASQAKL